MKKLLIFLNVLCVTVSYQIYPGYFLQKLRGTEAITPITAVSSLSEQKEILKVRKQELETVQQEFTEKEVDDKKALDRINQSIEVIEIELGTVDEQKEDFLNKKLSIVNEIHQTILNLPLARNQELSSLEKQIALLKEYVKDPQFEQFSIDSQSFYSIADLQSASKKVIDQERVIKNLTDQKRDAQSDLENKKRKLDTLQRIYNEKKKDQEEFASKSEELEDSEGIDLNIRERGQLLDLQLELAEWNKRLAKQQVKAAQRNVDLLKTTIFTEDEKLNKLKHNFDRVRTSLRIDEKDIQNSNEQLEKQKRTSLAERETYYKEIKELNTRKDSLKKDIGQLGKKYAISTADIRELTEWVFELKSPEEFAHYTELAYVAEEITLIDLRIDLLRAKIDLSTADFARTERQHDIMISWYKLSQRRYKDNDELVAEIKKYKDILSEAERDVTALNAKRSAAQTSNLDVYNSSLDNLKVLREKIDQNRQTLFADSTKEYIAAKRKINQSEEVLNKLLEVNAKLIETTSQRISIINGYIKDIEGIVAELETKSMWQRSAGAITWRGITNIVPDLNYFISDVRDLGIAYVSRLSWNGLLSWFVLIFSNLLYFLLLLFIIGLFFALTWFFKYRSETLTRYLVEGTYAYGGLAFIAKILAVIIGFVSLHFTSMYIWSILLWLVYTELITEPFLRVMFYLVSIAYLVYLIPKFVDYIVAKNREYEYSLFSESFERRFRAVFSIFAYVSVILLLFRQAFILATIHTSELPDILLATYSIITRILVIFSIGKDEILGIIPSRPAIWQWVSQFVESYYYVLITFIIALMIMSDPNVGGYGNLVSYIMWGVIETVVLLWVMYVVQIYLKNISSTIFFSTEEETLKERFTNAKTWYGLFTIVSFIFLGITVFFIGEKIWGLTDVFDHVGDWLSYGLWQTGIDPATGKYIWFTPAKLFTLLAFIISGFLVASALERFVIQRIFNLLLVDAGIQNTVSSIMRYATIFLFILIGFLWAQLDNILIAFGVVLATIGYMIKEPLSDFVSYFIILVQRPVQIGDYITISEEVQGVVRQITPRSVILRRKDSYTIVVPNSMFITQPINNWHYARNFVSFDDIIFSVPYSADPERVRELVAGVLDESINVLKSPKPIIRLDQFGDHGFIFMVRGFVTGKNILNKWEIASDIRFNITKALHKAGIKIAVPTRAIIIEKSNQDTMEFPDRG